MSDRNCGWSGKWLLAKVVPARRTTPSASFTSPRSATRANRAASDPRTRSRKASHAENGGMVAQGIAPAASGCGEPGQTWQSSAAVGGGMGGGRGSAGGGGAAVSGGGRGGGAGLGGGRG